MYAPLRYDIGDLANSRFVNIIVSYTPPNFHGELLTIHRVRILRAFFELSGIEATSVSIAIMQRQVGSIFGRMLATGLDMLDDTASASGASKRNPKDAKSVVKSPCQRREIMNGENFTPLSRSKNESA